MSRKEYPKQSGNVAAEEEKSLLGAAETDKEKSVKDNKEIVENPLIIEEVVGRKEDDSNKPQAKSVKKTGTCLNCFRMKKFNDSKRKSLDEYRLGKSLMGLEYTREEKHKVAERTQI